MDNIKFLNNQKAKDLAHIVKFFKKEDYCVLEGIKIIFDVFSNTELIKQIFFTPDAFLNYKKKISKMLCKVEGFYITNAFCKKITNTITTQGIFAIVLKKKFNIDLQSFKGVGLFLSNIQDPGNLGTIVRTSFAFGLKTIFVAKDCVNIYNSKVIRASAGTIFMNNIVCVQNINLFINNCGKNNIKTYACSVKKDSLSIMDINFRENSIFFLGNEGNGLDANICKLVDNFVTLPMKKKIDSLNVAQAACIIAWEFSKNM